MNNKISKIASLLGVSENNILELPEEIRNSMVTALDIASSQDKATAEELTGDLFRIWANASVNKVMGEISEGTGIHNSTLLNLDEQTKQELCFEYEVNKGNAEGIYEIVQHAVSISDLDKVAEILKVSRESLEILPEEAQVKLCGVYSMENGEDTLLQSLNEVMENRV